MPITDIGHLAIAAFDLDATLDFYAKLGIEESFRLHHDDGSVMLVYLHVAGDRFIEVFPGGPSSDDIGPGAIVSFRHMCLLTDDLHSLVAHLKEEDIPIDREISTGLDTNLQAWITDPDGNKIEFMQIAPESPQRAVADGRKPVIPSR